MSGTKTVAERLRRGSFNSSISFDCHLRDALGMRCPTGINCKACRMEIVNALADMIEAEQAERQLPEGIEWPRFEDGELVRIGDAFQHNGETKEITRVLFYETRTWLRAKTETCYREYEYLPNKPLKRPELEVLDADGVPIKVGDTVWYIRGGNAKTVKRIVDGFVEVEESIARLFPEQLTHRRPDTQKAINDDATMPPWRYCHEVLKIAETQDEAEMVEAMCKDLLARQRKLMGGE